MNIEGNFVFQNQIKQHLSRFILYPEKSLFEFEEESPQAWSLQLRVKTKAPNFYIEKLRYGSKIQKIQRNDAFNLQ